MFSDVLVIGSGGAGLRSAIEVKLMDLSVTVLGKRNKNDVHTGLAAGGINAAFGNIDTNDSWEQHFVDTFVEGYGLGDPKLIEIMTKESPELVLEIDEWGANFQKDSKGKIDQRFFGAHTYRRTCYSGDFTGRSIINTLIRKSDELNIPIYDSQYVTELIVDNNHCHGAISFNIYTKEIYLHIANSVIIATGGHTRIWKRSSSRSQENTGDGLYLGLKAGCQLTDMEMVQFHPTGMLGSNEVEGNLVTEAVRGEGGRLFNNKGERFMSKYDKKRMELSTRDKVTIANYMEIMDGRSSPLGGVFLDISHKSKDHIINKLPSIYNQFLDSLNIDISCESMEVAPTAHYSMGGLNVTPEDHWTGIKGLFAVGEVAGGLHGANRLGGNSLAEILVFGKRTGRAAANNSKKNKSKINSDLLTEKVLYDFNKIFKIGTEEISNLQEKVGLIMWDFCGVVRDESKLDIGIKQINDIKNSYENINLNKNPENYIELAKAFDLKASIISSEATLLCAKERKESRGAHQRSDYPEQDEKQLYNYKVKLKNHKDLKVFKDKINKLPESLEILVDNFKKIENFKGKLIE